MLGISVYFKDFDELYIQQALKIGVTDVFTSLHIPEEDLTNFKNKFLLLNNLCKKYKVNLVPDISPIVYQKLGVKNNDNSIFQKLKIRKLRLDFGFNEIDFIKQNQKNFDFVLNASTINYELIQQIRNSKINFKQLTFMHNFYPKVNTGLSKGGLIKKNQLLADYNIKTSAFVPGDLLKRFPFYTGLPTLEKHRGANPFVAAVELLKTTNTYGVLIGDSKAQIQTIKYINHYLQKQIITLPTNLERDYQFLSGKIFKLRNDTPDNILRLISSRKTRPINKTINRPIGTITEENKLAGRYSGELEIAKQNLNFSPTANYVGCVLPEYLPLLNLIDENNSVILQNNLK
ncbi:MAG: MupG family TIM beta-alpha barrel fold protein [Bifidobacteriaceae bacterium]|jgi:hypothetical protein|nr:MupG family TIM beta-alpha barrel fold protein [Bifidobacteriaceae bacterium]